jgi:hypothetical protein
MKLAEVSSKAASYGGKPNSVKALVGRGSKLSCGAMFCARVQGVAARLRTASFRR